MERKILGANGVEYDVRYGNQNLEIQRFDTITGLQKVFVFEDLSVGDFLNKRKEVIFMEYDISINGTRLEPGRRIGFADTAAEYDALIISEVGDFITKSIIRDFLKKIEDTVPADPETL